MRMLRVIKRWTSNARAWLRRLRFRDRRRAPRKEGRFEAPHRQLVSRLLLTFRAYRLYLPAAASRGDRLPLLVMLHGCGQDAQVFAEGTRMNQLADRHDFIVLYPEQSRTANPLGCWNWFQPAALKGAGAARLYGCTGNGRLRVLALHVFPNCLPPMMVQASLNLGWAILNAAGLSFIGLGVRPPTPEWGIMVAEGAAFIVSGEWWIALFPGLALMLAVFCFNLLGDGLRDLIDPRRRT